MAQNGNREKVEQLMTYQREMRMVEELRAELVELKCMAEESGVPASAAQGKAGGDKGRLTRGAERISDKQMELNARERRALQTADRLEAANEKLPSPRQRRVMRMVYLRGMSQREVALRMGYCRRQINRDHQDAVAAVMLAEPEGESDGARKKS